MNHYTNHCAAFEQFMVEHGIQPHAAIIDDGSLHRFHVNGDKSGSRNGWYVLHGDGIPAGTFGSWRAGIHSTWCAKLDDEMTNLERKVHRKRLQQMRLQRDAERQQRHWQAADQAARDWDNSTAANEAHPYLVSKGIPALHLRQQGALLLVPMIDANGALWNLQRIWPDGTKRFMWGGCVKGCFALFGDLRSGPIYVCEGVATGASIHEQSSIPTACAMNAGNLTAVCSVLARPDRQITICADNDHQTDGNPGITKGREAAATVGASLTWPDSCGLGCTCSDFNDVLNCVNASKGVAK
jgi:putative DNA primase/helicase